jgi:hypothetical protein
MWGGMAHPLWNKTTARQRNNKVCFIKCRVTCPVTWTNPLGILQKKSEVPQNLAARLSASCQVFIGEDQSLDTPVLRERLHDFGHVRECDFAVKEMVRLDQNRYAA